MVYAAAIVSLLLMVGGIAVIAGMIVSNAARIGSALLWSDAAPDVFVPAARERPANQPRLVAIRPLLRAAA